MKKKVVSKKVSKRRKTVRESTAESVRKKAAELAQSRNPVSHKTNGEEGSKKVGYLSSFRKGLEHDGSGNVKDTDAKAFADACEGLRLPPFERLKVGDPDEFRKWESPTSGAFYDLEGADAQAVTMPPAPEIDSEELAAEMAEVYLMALLRDVPFSAYDSVRGDTYAGCKDHSKMVADAIKALNSMAWFKDVPIRGLSKEAKARRRGKVTRSNLFRGVAAGESDGPYMSQFMVAGNADITSKAGDKNDGPSKDSGPAPFDKEGLIEYGAHRIDQRVRTATPGMDFMTNFKHWQRVQNGTDVANIQKGGFIRLGSKGRSLKTPPPHRFITTGRDLATYVHFDALYQAYLNGCLMLLGSGYKFQKGFPHEGKDNTKGFAQFGGPHILSLLTEVATRGLKAVRFQKFTVHRRARPEAIAGLIHLYKKAEMKSGSQGKKNPFAALKPLVDKLDQVKFGGKPLLEAINEANKGKGYFLPMAFPEGSPMHPAYGAGHATVAGACVTMLKAFFDTNCVDLAGPIFEANPGNGGSTLRPKTSKKSLTLLGELHKLASNISIGRNFAGVHYYTDYYESIRLGEEVARTVLEEQALTYTEKAVWKFPRFFGANVTIKTGDLPPVR